MLISVIIPGHNTPDAWWKSCLTSVLKALPVEGEVICVDDGSSVRPCVETGDERVRWIYLPRDVGPSAARNAGLKEARGKYVTFVDSDDELFGDIYRYCLDRLETSGADIAVFGVRTLWTAEGLHKDDLPREGEYGVLDEGTIKDLFGHCLLEYVWNKVFRREFLKQHGLCFEEDICPGEDTVFVLQCIRRAARWIGVGEIGSVYFRRGGTTLSRYLPRYAESMDRKAELWAEVATEVMPDCTPEYRLAMTWDNMWRKGTPYGWRARCAFAREHGLSVMKMVVKGFVKRFLFVRFVRRWRIKKMYPEAV